MCVGEGESIANQAHDHRGKQGRDEGVQVCEHRGKQGRGEGGRGMPTGQRPTCHLLNDLLTTLLLHPTYQTPPAACAMTLACNTAHQRNALLMNLTAESAVLTAIFFHPPPLQLSWRTCR